MSTDCGTIFTCGEYKSTEDALRDAFTLTDDGCIAIRVTGISGSGGGGDASAANQVTGNNTLSAINGKLPATLGQKAMANSMAVVIASDQTAIPITDNGGSVTVDGTVAVSTVTTVTTVTTVASVTAIANALPAGENHLGSVGGNTAVPTSTVTMSVAGAYVTGDYIGTSTSPQSFANAVRVSGGTGVVKSIRISDKTATAAVAMELWLFSATFTAPTDNAAWAITDAEAFTCLGVIPIDSTKWYASSNNKVYSDDTLSIIIKPAATSLFYALVARGSTPTWASGDLDIGLGILQD